MRVTTLLLVLLLTGCSILQTGRGILVRRGDAAAAVEVTAWGSMALLSQSNCELGAPPCPEVAPSFTDEKLQFFFEDKGDRIELYSDQDLMRICKTRALPEDLSHCSDEYFRATLRDIVKLRQTLFPGSLPVHLKVFLYLNQRGYFRAPITRNKKNWAFEMIHPLKMAESSEGAVFSPKTSAFLWAKAWLHEYIHTQDQNVLYKNTFDTECPAWLGGFLVLDVILDTRFDGTLHFGDTVLEITETDKWDKVVGAWGRFDRDYFSAMSGAYYTYQQLRSMALKQSNFETKSDTGTLPESAIPTLVRLVREVLHGKRQCLPAQ